MDPPIEEQSNDQEHEADSPQADGEGEEPVLLEASASSTINPVSMAGLQKPEMNLPVKPTQGGERILRKGGRQAYVGCRCPGYSSLSHLDFVRIRKRVVAGFVANPYCQMLQDLWQYVRGAKS